ncbi:MAG: PQQ-binding-like beta-propeller repeat protein [Patescibacteria group bacterium]|nr:PQQ-binding-like beta-propeller repeat protein [Patescibacteria group bacterium]
MNGYDRRKCSIEKKGTHEWASATGPANQRIGYPGARSTPTIDGERAYALGAAGILVCLDIEDGKVVWHKDLVTDFGGEVPNWGYSESVLVDGKFVVCTPGGRDNTLVALNKDTGEKVWDCNAGHWAAVVARNARRFIVCFSIREGRCSSDMG